NRAEPASEQLVDQLFDGFLDRCGPQAGPTAWVAADEDVVADHGRDPFNNFGAPMSARFMQGFVDVYDQANDRAWYSAIGAPLPAPSPWPIGYARPGTTTFARESSPECGTKCTMSL